jgi:acyl dehydratase
VTTLHNPPPLLPSWLRALTGGGKRLAVGASIPSLELGLAPRTVDPKLLAKYRKLCGFPQALAGSTGDTLPLTLPQVLAGPLHVAMLTDPKFPLPAMGIVHLRNRIEQTEALRVDQPFGLHAAIVAHRQVPQGIEFDVRTVATVEGREVWQSVLTALSRTPTPKSKSKTPKEKRAEAEVLPAPDRSLLLRVPEDIGRRYARVAGDWNPIHQHAISAKLFGFPRAIAHGMWSLARCVAEVQDDVPAGPLVCEVTFKRPVLLPSKVAILAWRQDGGVTFQLVAAAGSTVHLTGSLGKL